MSRGIDRERAVVRWYRDRDYVAGRAPASLGEFDVWAKRHDTRLQLVEVKSTASGPYERFGPDARARLLAVAEMAGAEAWLAWWPPRGELQWIPASAWPKPAQPKAVPSGGGTAE